MTDTPCRICGKGEAEHHRFLKALPKGCKCPPGTYDTLTEALAICAGFTNKAGEAWCEACGHDAACHEEKSDA
jgi:hypothetical protein